MIQEQLSHVRRGLMQYQNELSGLHNARRSEGEEGSIQNGRFDVLSAVTISRSVFAM